MPISGGSSLVASDVWKVMDAATALRAVALDDLGAIATLWEYVASDDLLESSDAKTMTSQDTYIKMKTIVYEPTPAAKLAVGSTLRISFELRTDTSPEMVFAEIRKNDVAVGTERTNNTETYVEYSEDIGGWDSGDLIQIWQKAPEAGIGTCDVINFRVYGMAQRQEDTGVVWV